MKSEVRAGLDEAQTMIAEAQRLNHGGKAPASIEKAYNASNKIAAVYLKEVEGQDLPVNDNTYYLFSKSVDQPTKHPIFAEQIMDTVRNVSFLHEAYEPNLLAETTTKDAQQMIDHVSALSKVIEEVLA